MPQTWVFGIRISRKRTKKDTVCIHLSLHVPELKEDGSFSEGQVILDGPLIKEVEAEDLSADSWLIATAYLNAVREEYGLKLLSSESSLQQRVPGPSDRIEDLFIFFLEKSGG